MPEMKEYQSSQIHSIGFDEDAGEVHIRFRDRTRKDGTVVPGATYAYPDCSVEDHAHLCGAESIGSWFHKYFRGRECRRVE